MWTVRGSTHASPLQFRATQRSVGNQCKVERGRVPVCFPGRFVGVVFACKKSFSTSCGAVANIEVHHGKTKVWNRAGVKPAGCDELTAAARLVKEEARVWTIDQGIPAVEQGMRVLGSPIGHPDFVQSFLRRKVTEHCTWSASLSFLICNQRGFCCCIAQLPKGISGFGLCFLSVSVNLHTLTTHLCAILHVDPDAVSPTARDMATLPLSMGGLGLRSAFRLRQAAHWASWGRDCLEMIRDRCPLVFDRMMRSLTSRRGEQPLSIEAARQSAGSPDGRISLRD